MADSVMLANWADFLTELMESRQIVFGHEHPLLSELSGLQKTDYVITRDPNQQRFTKAMDTNRATFHGSKVTVPLQLSDVSAQSAGEGDTYAEPVGIDTDQANYNLKSVHAPIGLTVELERDAKDGSTSALSAVEGLTESAYRAAARRDNDFLHGNGTGLLAAVSANTGSGSLVVYVGTGTGVNWDQLTPGRIVDVLTRSSGADPGNGNRRKIASIDRSAGTVTFFTTAVASDGDSGNITHSTSDGIYIDGSWAAASTGVTPAGLGNVVSTTDTTYGNIDKTAVARWQGVSVTASGILADEYIDTALYYLRGNGVGAPDFGIAHPLTVNPYKNSMQSMVKVDMQTTIVKSGFKGIVCQAGDTEFPILKDLAAPRAKCRLVTKSSLKIYGDGVAPGFLDDDGSMFRFPGRSTKKEADLFDRWQLGSRDCGKNAEIGSLSES